jgi:hypothetical protein
VEPVASHCKSSDEGTSPYVQQKLGQMLSRLTKIAEGEFLRRQDFRLVFEPLNMKLEFRRSNQCRTPAAWSFAKVMALDCRVPRLLQSSMWPFI